MKKIFYCLGVIALLSSCTSPVSMTTWVNPESKGDKLGKVLVWAMFDRPEYRQPFEQSVTSYIQQSGINAISALKFLAPGAKYEYKALEQKFDSIGADEILIFTYQNTEKQDNYVPPTTTAYPDYYYNYYNYYSWGYPYYNSVTTGGYWTTTTIVHVTANLYGNSKDNLVWSSDIAITDPKYIDEIAFKVAKKIVSDWRSKGLAR